MPGSLNFMDLEHWFKVGSASKASVDAQSMVCISRPRTEIIRDEFRLKPLGDHCLIAQIFPARQCVSGRRGGVMPWKDC